MAVAAGSGHRSGGGLSRAPLAIAGLLLVGTGAWFAGSWIDTGGDSTCGAVIYPGLWLYDRNGCRGVMALRGSVSAGTIAVGGALIWRAGVRRAFGATGAAAILTIAVVTSGAMLLINELVRSGGAF